jgi:hypothetical protein
MFRAHTNARNVEGGAENIYVTMNMSIVASDCEGERQAEGRIEEFSRSC